MLLVFFIFSFFLSLGTASTAFAQADNSSEAALGVARVIAIEDDDIPNGSIVSTTENGAKLSTTPYDPQVLGVVSRDAGIILNNSTNTGVPVISVGTVYILVSAKEGTIADGDLLTTSTIPGVGVKALDNGYVLGTALEDYSGNEPGLIAAQLNLHYYNTKPTFPGSLTDIFKFALLPTENGPTALFKYIVAALVALASFVLAFLTFGRTAAKGVEALGRNPSASRIIHLGIILNVGIVVVIVAAGLVVAFLILRL